MRIVLFDNRVVRKAKLLSALAKVPGAVTDSSAVDGRALVRLLQTSSPDLVLIPSHLADRSDFSEAWSVVENRALRVARLLADGEMAPCSGLAVDLNESDLLADPVKVLARLGRSRTRPDAEDPIARGPAKLILIGASTGGVDALLTVLGAFPADCPPTLIVQHTTSQYLQGLADLLDRHCRPKIRLATDESVPQRGLVLLPPNDGRHLVMQPGLRPRIRLDNGPPVNGHKPSVDVLFRSALPYAHCVSAALLTGMGQDGADGLWQLRKAGARTIGQDSETSVVYGMPRVAREMGAVERELPLTGIADALLGRWHGRAERIAG